MMDQKGQSRPHPPCSAEDVLTRPGRFVFWTTAPFLLAFLVLMPFLVRPDTTIGWVVFGACELLALLTLLGFMAPTKFEWCLRTAAMLLFLAFVAYFVSEAWGGNWDGKGANALKALLGMVLIGLPALRYALLGAKGNLPLSEEGTRGSKGNELPLDALF